MSPKPILYYIPGSPPVRTVLMVAKLLDLDLDLKFVDMGQGEHLKPEFLKLNPQHTVPTLVDDGKPLVDSHAISTYLICKYGKEDHPLYPKDLYIRARIDQRLQFDTAVLYVILREMFYPMYIDGAYEIPEKAIQKGYAAYDFLETFLTDEPYLVGNHLTVADFSIITTVTQLAAVVPLDAAKYPNLTNWIRRFEEMPYFYEMNTEKIKAHMKFLDGLRAQNKAAAEARNK